MSFPRRLVSLAVLAAVTPAFAPALSLANDTSVPAIEVDSIDTNTKVGSYMNFKGAEAAKLMAVLPKVSSAGGPFVEEHIRHLNVKSPGYMISISCSDLNFAGSGPTLVTPSCSLIFNRRIDESDDLPFVPATQCRAE